MPPKDLTETLGSDNGGMSNSDFPPPSAADWAKIDADTGTEPEPETPDQPDEPATEPEVETAEAPDETLAEDPEIDLPDGSKMKFSELQALRAGKAPAAPAAKPAAPTAAALAAERTQLAREREEFAALQAEHKAGIQEILNNPDKYKELQRAAGVNLEPSPGRDQQKWLKYRQDQYIQAGWKPEEVTRDILLNDLFKAQTIENGRELTEMRTQLKEREREVVDQRHFDSVSKELEGLYARPDLAYAATAEGRDIVDALLAQADRDGKDVHLEDIVRKVHEHGARLIQGYVGKKQADVKATGKLLRGGGTHRAPEPKDFGSGYDGFGKIARERMRNGG